MDEGRKDLPCAPVMALRRGERRSPPRSAPSFPTTPSFTQSACKWYRHADASASNMAVKVVLMTRPSVQFTEQLFFTSVYKVKPPALILPKNQND